MTTTYSTPLRLAKQETGDNANTWGDILNDNVIELVEQAIAETSTIDLTVGTGDYTLTTSNGAVDEARSMALRFTGSPTVNRNIVIPALSKAYIVYNGVSTAYSVIITTGSGSTATVAPGKKALVYCDGTEVVMIANAVLPISLSAEVTGTLPIANGGTGNITANAALNALLPSQTGNADKVLKTNGTNSSWESISPAIPISALTGTVLYGLTLSNSTVDAVNDITIAPGACVSDDGTTVMIIGSAITKQVDGAWAVGDNQGGRDTGSIADGWWHVWIIERTDTGVTDALFSLSPTNPTLPANYSVKKCIGSVYRSGGALASFIQNKNEYIWKTPPALSFNAAVSTTAAEVTATVPTGVKVKALYNAYLRDNGYALFISSLDTSDLAVDFSASPLATFGTNAVNTTYSGSVWTDTSAKFRIRSSGSTVGRVATLGWIDPRI